MKKAITMLAFFSLIAIAKTGFSQNACCPQESQEYLCGPCVTYCKYVKYEPQYYCQKKCEYVRQTKYKKCCRYVDRTYQERCCRYVPQYYYVTKCRKCPEYYYQAYCTYCPKYTYEKKCRYVPKYYCKPCYFNPNQQNACPQQNCSSR